MSERDGGDGGHNANTEGGLIHILDYNCLGPMGMPIALADVLMANAMNLIGNGLNGLYPDTKNGLAADPLDNGVYGSLVGNSLTVNLKATVNNNGHNGTTPIGKG